MGHLVGWVSANEKNTNEKVEEVRRKLQQKAYKTERFAAFHSLTDGKITTKKMNGQTYVLFFCGELWNRNELRKQWQNGGRDTAMDDAEFALACYAEWGQRCFEKMDGRYVFVLWNEEEETLLLARDRLGIKRLFYKIERGKLIFSTDFKDLVTVSETKPEINEDSLAHILSFRSILRCYYGIEELEPAHQIIYDKGKVTKRCYWQVENKQHRESINETADHLRSLLMEAVKNQIEGKKEVSLIYERNIETIVLLPLASQCLQDELLLWTNEREKWFPYFPVKTNSYTIKEENIMPFITETPIMDDSFISYHFPLTILSAQKGRFRAKLSTFGQAIAFGTYEAFSERNRLAADDFPLVRDAYAKESFLNEKWRKKISLARYLDEKYAALSEKAPLLQELSKKEEKRRRLSYVVWHWLILPQVQQINKWGEKENIQIYFPYLDANFFKYMWNVPLEMKQLAGMDKGILRKAFEGLVPFQNENFVEAKPSVPIYLRLVAKQMNKIIENKESPLFFFLDKKKLKAFVEDNHYDERTFRIFLDFIQLEKWLNEVM